MRLTRRRIAASIKTERSKSAVSTISNDRRVLGKGGGVPVRVEMCWSKLDSPSVGSQDRDQLKQKRKVGGKRGTDITERSAEGRRKASGFIRASHARI